MTPLVLPLPGNERLAADLATRLGATVGRLVVRRFPDGETYVRIEDDVAGRAVLLACTLDRPDEKLVPLLLAAATARDLGAARTGLVAPYLSYMRQDARFVPGEGVTSRYVARVLSAAVDGLVTVDPHLHRHASLADLFTIPSDVAHAADPIAAWLRAHVPDALLVGPDGESEQWVADVAARAGVPHVVLTKTRHGDRQVEVALPAGFALGGRTPVLVDDILSTGRTMTAAIAHLAALRAPRPVCVAIHAVFAGDAHADLLAAGAADVVTCDTIPHPSNRIPVGAPLAASVRTLLGA